MTGLLNSATGQLLLAFCAGGTVRRLPDGVEPVRLYASYLRNFEIEAGRASG